MTLTINPNAFEGFESRAVQCGDYVDAASLIGRAHNEGVNRLVKDIPEATEIDPNASKIDREIQVLDRFTEQLRAAEGSSIEEIIALVASIGTALFQLSRHLDQEYIQGARATSQFHVDKSVGAQRSWTPFALHLGTAVLHGASAVASTTSVVEMMNASPKLPTVNTAQFTKNGVFQSHQWAQSTLSPLAQGTDQVNSIVRSSNQAVQQEEKHYSDKSEDIKRSAAGDKNDLDRKIQGLLDTIRSIMSARQAAIQALSR